ncbi:MAG: hypothetical protein JRH01_21375, partial [Deltaproteobacteria bacterium]|nr:hypothetical protein [Deltaproteobacteria bacterium]
AAPPKPHCTGSLEEIQLAYLGNLFGSDCSVSNPQSGQASCTGDDLWDEDVSISLLTAGLDGDPLSGIGVRGLFAITPTNSWEALPSSLDFIATDSSGNTQTVGIRTDCDESLNLGDRFGDFVVFGLDRGDGDQHNGHHGCDSDSDSDTTATSRSTWTWRTTRTSMMATRPPSRSGASPSHLVRWRRSS